MKAKYLFYSLALASAFTACSQEELFDAPALDSNEVAGRPAAGVVTFVNDEVDSRYNRQNATFVKGDKMGIYLMDTFNGFEALDANETHWNYQSSWWAMYRMDNNIHTNYGYEYDGNNTWVNRASQLNEGNYIAMFPQNELATNRRDLWHAIDGNVDLVAHTDKERYYVNRDNQFFLGYEQIKRDQKPGTENGELKANISMKPIMTYAKFALENQAANNFKIKKLVFKLKGGMPLPNVAYVKPSLIAPTVPTSVLGYKIQGETKKHDAFVTAPWWAFDTEAVKEGHENACGELLAWSKYDRNSFSQAGARSMVQYASTATGYIPYGMTEEQAAPIYEYVFNFPADTEILYGTGSKESAEAAENRVCHVSIALPAFGFAKPDRDNDEDLIVPMYMQDDYSYYWKDMQVVVYGEYYDPIISAYRPGIIRALDGVDNANFGLDNMQLWEMGEEIPVGKVTIDDHYFYQEEEIRVENTQDLITLLNARLTDPQTAVENGKINFNVYPYGESLEITNDVINVIKAYEAKHKSTDVVVEFHSSGSIAGTPNIVLKAENCIDEFLYNGVDVTIEAKQTVKDVVIYGINDIYNYNVLEVIEENATTSLTADDIHNEKNAIINVENATLNAEAIENHGTITLKNAYANVDELYNESVLTTSSTSNNSTTITGTVYNKNTCLNCGTSKAELTVKSTKTLIGKLINADNVTVEAGATLITEFENAGYVKVLGTIEVKNNSVNSKTIDIEAGAEVKVVTSNTLANTGTINVKGELKQEIANTGYIFVKEDGHVIVNGTLNEGTMAGIIDVTYANGTIKANAAKDIDRDGRHNYFRYDVLDEVTAAELDKALKARISENNYTGKKDFNDCRIIVRWMPERTTATRFLGVPASNIVHIDINKNLDFETNSKYTVTGFETLADVNWAVAYWIKNTDKITANQQDQYTPAMTIASGVLVQVDNDAVFTLKEQLFTSTAFSYTNDGYTIDVVKADKLNVKIDGKFKANNASEVLGNVAVSGRGVVEIDNNNEVFQWERWTLPVANWYGK